MFPLRSFLVALAALALFPVFGCRRADNSAQPDTFIFARGSDAQKLDPADIDDGESVNTVTQICEGLVRFKSGTLEIEPCLAKDYAISEDGLLYTFHLREGVTFHDGTPLNAKNAIWSFQRQMDPGHPGHVEGANFQYWNYLYQDIVEVRAADEMTVEIRLAQPNATILASLAIFPAFLLSPASLEANGADFQRRPVGTGPYRFVSWTPNQAITMEANPDYWDRERQPQFPRLVMKVVPENSVRLLELKSGRIHGLDGVAPAELAALEGDPRFTVYRDAGLNVGYLVWNQNHERYRNPEVRLAMALAIDRELLASVALEGAGRAAACPLPPGMLGYPENPAAIAIPHDPERARALVEANAGDFAEPIRIQVMTAPRMYLPDPVKATSLIRAQLEAAGMKVEIVARDFKSHLDSLRNFDFDAAVIGWVGDNGDPDNFLSIFFASWATEPGSATNYSNYKNPEMDALLLAARAETDPAERARIYHQVIDLWRRDLPILPLVHGDNLAVTRSEVTHFRIQKIGDLRLGNLGWKSKE
ncbi:MAG: ABC transporter substrate-binding protein [Opitutaceae bacterium]